MKSYAAHFVRGPSVAALERRVGGERKLRILLGTVEAFVDSPWLTCGFAKDAAPPDDGVLWGRYSLAQLPSKTLGDVLYLYVDRSDGSLVYEHARDGILQRKLTWFPLLDPSRAAVDRDFTPGWLCARGGAEPWESAAFFRPEQLTQAIQAERERYQDNGKAGEYPAREQALRSMWDEHSIRPLETLPNGAAYAGQMEAQFRLRHAACPVPLAPPRTEEPDPVDVLIQDARAGSPEAMVALAKLGLPRQAYAQAFELLTRAAKLGSREAKVVMATLRIGGKGVPQDVAAGLAALREAAREGDVRATYFLGLTLKAMPQHGGRGEFVSWLQQAAELGDGDACWQLAEAYLHGQQVAESPDQAHPWLIKGSALHHPDCLSNLGVQYFAGLGARKDADQAFACFQEGAELGNADAQASLAVCLADGIGTVIDLVAARQWARLAVLNGNERAGTILAQITALE
jgi:hypothetical protein